MKNIFGFLPGNIFLYKLALRHKSAAKVVANGIKVSNERLEYLGDAVLGTIVADFMFKKFPYKDEGFLTEMRSKVVKRSQLNSLAQKLGIDKLINSTSESRSLCKSINGDAFEAFIGAMYLDKGYEFTKKVVINRIINVHLDIDTLEKQNLNYKSRLIEWSQKERKTVEYKVIEEIGDGYKKQYLVEVEVDGKAMGRAQDHSIKGAEQLASEKAVQQLKI
ncbi:MAG: ribonuclease III [Bacteroidetes bacterium]|nr:ribonuclease III [Bacteroidota bacterium]